MMVDELPTRKRGAPIGNQNARKHGYYSRVPTPEPEKDISNAENKYGIDIEIDLLRSKIIFVLKNDPYNYRILRIAFRRFVRLLYRRQIILACCRKLPRDHSGTLDQFLDRIVPH